MLEQPRHESSSDDDHQRALDAIEARLERIVDAALAAPFDTRQMFDHVYATDTPRIAQERADLARRTAPPHRG